MDLQSVDVVAVVQIVEICIAAHTHPDFNVRGGSDARRNTTDLCDRVMTCCE